MVPGLEHIFISSNSCNSKCFHYGGHRRFPIPQVRASGIRLAYVLLHDVQVPAARWQICTRLVHAINVPGRVNVNKPALSDDIRAAGSTTVSSVQSAYVELFQHVVIELEHELSRRTEKGRRMQGSGLILLLLSLLQTLMTTILRPPLLQRLARASTCDRQPPLAAGVKCEKTNRPYHPYSSGCEASAMKCPQRWLNMSERPESNQPIVHTTATFVEDSEPGIPVLLSAVSVLGELLNHEGDILRPNSWSLGRFNRVTVFHYAAWRTLGVLSIQLCSPSFSAPVSGRHSNLQFEAGGEKPGSTPKEIQEEQEVQEIQEGQSATPGATRKTMCWMVTQAVLSILFREAERVCTRLEELLLRHGAEQRILGTTGAVRLVTGPASFPLPAIPKFPELAEDEPTSGFALSFWVWVPDQNDLDVSRGKQRFHSGQRKTDKSPWRSTIFTRVHHGSLGYQAEKSAGCPQVFLTQVSPDEDKTINATTPVGDPGNFYVEICLLLPKNAFMDEEKQLDSQERFDGKGKATGKHFSRHRFLSGCPLPVKRWTHVWCGISDDNGQSGISPLDIKGDYGCDDSTPLPDVTVAFDGFVIAKKILYAGEDAKAYSMSLQSNAHNIDRKESESKDDTSSSLSPSQPRGGTPLLCDLYWHPRKVTPDQVRRMAETGVRAHREGAHCIAERYMTRLVTVSHDLACLSQRVKIALAAPQWVSLWLKLVSNVGHYTQRAIFHLLRDVLSTPYHSVSEGTEGGKGYVATPNISGHDTRDRVIVELLCGFIGNYVASRSYGGDNADIRGSRVSQVWKGGAFSQEPSIVSEVVSLFRGLVREAPTRWREHIFESLTAGLVEAAKEDCSTQSIPPLPANSDSAEPVLNTGYPAWLGSAIAATYMGGGHIDGPRLGARVYIRPDRRAVSNNVNSSAKWQEKKIQITDVCPHIICSSEDLVVLGEEAITSACTGTVLGWKGKEGISSISHDGNLIVALDEQYTDCLDVGFVVKRWRMAHNRLPTARLLTSVYVVAIPLRAVEFQEETCEPPTPFLLGAALPAVHALLESASLPNIGGGTLPRFRSTDPNSLGMNLVSAHIRCRLLRALAVQLRLPNPKAVDSKVFHELLNLSVTNLASAVVLALGPEGAMAFGQRRHLAAISLSLGYRRAPLIHSDCSLMTDLESASQVVWQRLGFDVDGRQELRRARYRVRSVMDTGKGSKETPGPVVIHPRLQVLDGEALVEGNRVTASSHFPTVRLSHVGVDSGMTGGPWYYEVTLLTGGLMQLGWAGSLFRCSPVQGRGVGDNRYSWAFDGFRQKRWCASSALYGDRWQAGDVVGVLLDAVRKEMRFR